MAASASMSAYGALLGNLVLAAALFLNARFCPNARVYGLYALAFIFHALRLPGADISQLFGSTAGLIYCEFLHAAAGTAFFAAAGVIRPGRRTVGILFGLGILLWLLISPVLFDAFWTVLPVSVYSAFALFVAALSLHRRKTAPSRVAASLFAVWGSVELAAPFLFQAEWFSFFSITAVQVLSTATVLALLAGAERERRSLDDVDRRRAQALLKLQGEAMAATANSVFITNRGGRIEWCNPAFSELTGWRSDEAVGRGARRLLMSGLRDGRLVEALSGGKVWRGELQLRRRDGTFYVVDQTVTPIMGDDGRPAHYVVVQEDVTERRQAEERIRFLSNHDPLTSLPNRLLFREQIQRAVARAKAERSGAAILVLDLDDFSSFNDILGHDGGDRLLLAAAERITGAARGRESVARVGGDEFAVLLVSEDCAESAAETAEELLRAVLKPFDFDGHEIVLGASIGIALFPSDGTEADQLLKNADIAMYRAMRDHPNGYRFFAPNMDAELAERRLMESDLRKAVGRGELELHYQPIVSAPDRRVVAFEALVRWRRPGHGLVSPDKFIPLAEANGMICSIGEWVLHRACAQLREWINAGFPSVAMAVNLSAQQLKRQDVAFLVRRALTENHLPAGLLELELTESAVMEDSEAALKILNDVAALGVKLAIDDFGTGYSSLERLKRFPVGKLKIDRSFIADMATDAGDLAIAGAVTSMGRALGLQVVAEGVETEQQLALLAKMGCNALQGFLFSRPVDADQAASLLKRGLI